MNKLLTVFIFTIINTGLLLAEQETPVVTKAFRDSIAEHLKMSRRFSTNARTMDFKQARAHIGRLLFLSDSLQTDDAMNYVAAGDVEDLAFNAERNKPALGKKMDENACLSAAKKCYLYYQEAYNRFTADADRYGRSGEKQQKRIQQLALQYYLLTKGFQVNAGQSYKKQQLEQALQEFRMSIEGSQSSFLLDAYRADAKRFTGFEDYLADSTQCRTLYNCASIAAALNQLDLSLAYYDSLKVRNYEPDKVYRNRLAIFSSRQDTTLLLSELQSAIETLPAETWYKKNLLQIYLDRQQWKEAETVALECLKADTTDAPTICVLGQLSEMHGDIDQAMTCYLRSYALDTTQCNVCSYIGRIHYNRAIALKTSLYNGRLFKQIDEAVQPVFDQALPWYMRAYRLDAKREDTSIPMALREILYSRFTKTRCPNRSELIAQYNEISEAYGMAGFMK